MALSLGIVLAYLAASLAIGMAARRRGRGLRDYVLGGGSSALRLFATMAATNFSAFTVFGLSGAGYRLGWAYYPLMAFGTGLMALSFFFLGMPLRKLSAERGYLSPADFVAERYRSPALAKAFSLALILLTLPYLATQALAGGRMLEAAAGIPYALGSLLVAGITTAYTLGGGFRAVTATDAFQLLVLFGGAGAAFLSILGRAGGLRGLGERLLSEAPGLLSRSGEGGAIPLGSLLGFWLLWLLADPLFPQLFQRFYAARDDRSLGRSAALYPLATGSIFFLTISVGVAGAVLLPGLQGPATEQVFTRLSLGEGRELLAGLFILAALAALMSTMDSQLLALSSMLAKDFLPPRARTVSFQGLIIGALGLAAWLVAQRPPTLILNWLTGFAFPGYALLAPLVILGLYGRLKAGPAAVGLGAGFLALILEASGRLGTGPLPQSVFNLLLELGAMGLASLVGGILRARRGAEPRAPVLVRLGDIASPAWLLALAALVGGAILAQAFLPERPLLLGLPPWLLGSALACVLLSLLFATWKRPGAKEGEG